MMVRNRGHSVYNGPPLTYGARDTKDFSEGRSIRLEESRLFKSRGGGGGNVRKILGWGGVSVGFFGLVFVGLNVLAPHKVSDDISAPNAGSTGGASSSSEILVPTSAVLPIADPNNPKKVIQVKKLATYVIEPDMFQQRDDLKRNYIGVTLKTDPKGMKTLGAANNDMLPGAYTDFLTALNVDAITKACETDRQSIFKQGVANADALAAVDDNFSASNLKKSTYNPAADNENKGAKFDTVIYFKNAEGKPEELTCK